MDAAASYHLRMGIRLLKIFAVNFLLWVVVLPVCLGLYYLTVQQSYFSGVQGISDVIVLTFFAPVYAWLLFVAFYIVLMMIGLVSSTVLGMVGMLQKRQWIKWCCLMLTPVAVALMFLCQQVELPFDSMMLALITLVAGALVFWVLLLRKPASCRKQAGACLDG